MAFRPSTMHGRAKSEPKMPALTDIFVRTAKPPERGSLSVFDTTTRGLCLRISAGGTKSFCLVQGKQRTRTNIGKYPQLSLADARAECRRIIAERTLGLRRPEQALAADKAVEAFIAACEQRNKPRTISDYRRLLARHFTSKFSSRSLDAIKTQDVSRIIDELRTTPTEQNHAHTAMAIFLRWCVRRGYIERSPMERLQLPARLKARARTLTEEELATLWVVASEQGAFGQIVKLCILLGQRRSEIGQLQWHWINDKERTITFPAEVIKNNRLHTIPYGAMASTIIGTIPRRSDYLFPGRDPTHPFVGWSKSKSRLDIALRDLGKTISPWTLHDLRRSAATVWAGQGVAPHIVERILNHATGQISGVAAIYNRHAYLDEMRAAIDAWEKRLSVIIAQHNSDDTNASQHP
jgi:integrase